MSKNKRARSYVFTLNNYSAADEARIQGIDCRYLVYGREAAPTTGTLHLQGYLYFSNAKSFTAAKRLIGDTAHLEVARGTPSQSRTYCVKDGDFFEKGDLPQQGKRSELEELKQLIDEDPAVPSLQLYDTAFPTMVRYGKSILQYRQLKTPPRRHKTEVLWLYGATGTGKSRHAYESFPDAYSKNVANKWWDGYDQHQTVILDDLRPHHFSFNFLLKLFDRYPMTIEVKGGTAQFVAKTIIVTTNLPAKEFAELQSAEDHEQLMRRITDEVPF